MNALGHVSERSEGRVTRVPGASSPPSIGELVIAFDIVPRRVRRMCVALGVLADRPPCAVVVAFALLACSRSSETTKTLAYAGKDATLLGASDGRVFWSRGNSVIWWDAALGRKASHDIDGAHWASRSSVIVDSSGLLFVHHNRLEHLAPPLRGAKGFTQTRIVGEHANGLVRDGDCAYVLDGDVECWGEGAVIGVALVDGVTCPTLPVPANGLQPLAFAGDAKRFFWSDAHCAERHASPPAGISVVDRATGISTLIVPDESAAELEVGKRGVYWRGRFGVRLASGDSVGSVPVVAGTTHSLVVDDGIIYYAADDGIHWVSEDGGPDRIVPQTAGVRQFVLDARHLYWLTPANDVVRAARPN